MAIGVTGGVSEDLLKLIASDPDDTHYFYVNNFAGLEKLSGILAEEACSSTAQSPTPGRKHAMKTDQIAWSIAYNTYLPESQIPTTGILEIPCQSADNNNSNNRSLLSITSIIH